MLPRTEIAIPVLICAGSGTLASLSCIQCNVCGGSHATWRKGIYFLSCLSCASCLKGTTWICASKILDLCQLSAMPGCPEGELGSGLSAAPPHNYVLLSPNPVSVAPSQHKLSGPCSIWHMEAGACPSHSLPDSCSGANVLYGMFMTH